MQGRLRHSTPKQPNERKTKKNRKQLEVKEPLPVLSLWVLTELTPMKFNRGFAPEIRNIAWRRPRMPPITNVDEADGICLLSGSNLAISKLLPSVFGWHEPSLDSEDQNKERTKILMFKL